MHEPVPQPPAENPTPQPQHEVAPITYEWLSARVAELDALDDRTPHSDEQGCMEWSQQYQELGRRTLDSVREHPDKGKATVEAMTLSKRIADKRFIARQLADYMSIEGHAQDGAENFATLLLDEGDGEASEAAAFALNDAVDEGKLAAHQVAHIALTVADFARWRTARLESSQTPPQ